MPEKWTYFFGEGTSEGDPERKDVLGGKGASLAAMSRAGLRVPPGFTIPIACCEHYHAHGGRWPDGLEDQVREHLARLEKVTGLAFGKGARPLLVSVRSGAAVSMPGMMDTLLNCGLSPALADETGDPEHFWRVYAQFVRQFGKTIHEIPEEEFDDAAEGVSSAKETAERFLKLYHVRTHKDFPDTPWGTLVECIDGVFESWNNERAITYRKSQDVRGATGTAVNVQTMFPSEVSGIAFTANPADPFAEEVIIESAYGLGEAIVSGDVAPDLFVLDYATLEIKQRMLGHKDVSFAGLDASSRAGRDASEFSLTDDEVKRIAELALRVEDYFGYPVDIEWGIVADEIALLQSRAVRGLDVARDIEIGRDEEIRRLHDLSAGKRKVWVVHNLAETLTAPTPMSWSITKHYMSGVGGYGRMYRDLGYRPSETICRDGFLELICGRIYTDPDRASEMFWGISPLEYDLDAVVADPKLIETAPKKLNAAKADPTFLARAPGLIWTMLRSSRRMKRARRRAHERFEHEILPEYLSWVEKKRREDLSELATEALIAELQDRVTCVFDDFGAESLKPGFFGGIALSTLETTLVQLMGEEKGRALVGVLSSGLEGDSTIEQNLMLFRVAMGEATLEDFLESYGHRTVGEMELAEPRWHEDPSYLERMTASYKRPGTVSPEERHHANVERRKETEARLPDMLAECGGSAMREDIDETLAEVQALLPYREIGKHYLMMGYDLVRMCLVELAHRWDLGRDIFFLEFGELPRFEAERETLTATIARRKMRWQSAQRLVHPDLIDSQELDDLGKPRAMADASEYKAQPLAPGVAEGTMRIISSPAEAYDLPSDCILVCPSTDPGWTAIFTNIRGLVVERGGMLSHGAITARDFGIPAVACAEATRLLEGALRLRVDGNRGLITVLNGPSTGSGTS